MKPFIPAALLAYQFGLTARGLGANLEGISDEEGRRRPPQGGNSINWVVGHIVSYRRVVLELLGEQPTWPKERTEAYGRGSSGDARGDQILPLAQLMEDLQATTAAIVKRLEALPDGALETPGPNPKQTLGQHLAFLSFHESYHAGQVGLLRRLAGKPGAIR
ncbi:MAG TPA: DinB family protein [Candidatus Krumholzibacteria bacterium]|nr:DinB family protein [Candidatus Krumholzibacteria bacterium]